jgi:mannose-6-phosphate isomerase-like protein (cupin superfamily)
MKIDKVNIEEKLALITEYWHPHIVGKLNGQLVKLAKLKGEFIWHKHEKEDELFWVINGSFEMHLRDNVININKGDFIVIPKDVEHKPVAKDEVHIMLFEPETTINTGDVENSYLTRNQLKEI